MPKARELTEAEKFYIENNQNKTDLEISSVMEGVGAKTQSRLTEAGIESIQELSSKSVEELTSIPGIGQKTAEKLVALAQAEFPAEIEEEAAPEEVGLDKTEPESEEVETE